MSGTPTTEHARHRDLLLYTLFFLSGIGNTIALTVGPAMAASENGAWALPISFLVGALIIGIALAISVRFAGFRKVAFKPLPPLIGLSVTAWIGAASLRFAGSGIGSEIGMISAILAWPLSAIAIYPPAIESGHIRARRKLPSFQASSGLGMAIGAAITLVGFRYLDAWGLYAVWGALTLIMAISATTIGGHPASNDDGAEDWEQTLKESPFWLLISLATLMIIGLGLLGYSCLPGTPTPAGISSLLYPSALLHIGIGLAVAVASLAVRPLLSMWGACDLIVATALFLLIAVGLLFLPGTGPLHSAPIGYAIAMVVIGTPGIPMVHMLYPRLYDKPPIHTAIFAWWAAGLGITGIVAGTHAAGLASDSITAGVGLVTGALTMIVAVNARGAYISALLEKLNTERANAAPEMVDLIGTRPGAPTHRSLREALADRRPEMRVLALQTLEAMRPADWLKVIRPLLHDPNMAVRLQAIRTWGQLTKFSLVPGTMQYSAAVEALRELQDDNLPSILQSEVLVALERVDSQGRDSRLAQIRDMLSSDEANRRVAAIRAIAAGERIELAPKLREMLHDERPWVREEIVRALGKLKYTDAIPDLIELLKVPDRILRAALIQTLAELAEREPAAVAARLDDAPMAIRAALIEALARSGRAEELSRELSEAATNDLDALRDGYEAWMAMGVSDEYFNAPGLIGLLGKRLDELREVACRATLTLLQVLADGDAVKSAIAALDSPDPSRRADALDVLLGMGHRTILRSLAPFYLDGGISPRGGPDALEHLDDHWIKKVLTAIRNPEAVMDDLEKILALKEVKIFAGLSLDELEAISLVTTEAEFPAGAVVLRQGEPGDGMYLILAGSVRVVLQLHDGTEETLNIYRAGDTFGELALLDEGERTASVIASEPLRTLVIRRDDFRRVLYRYPEIASSVIKMLSNRLRSTTEMLKRLPNRRKIFSAFDLLKDI